MEIFLRWFVLGANLLSLGLATANAQEVSENHDIHTRLQVINGWVNPLPNDLAVPVTISPLLRGDSRLAMSH